MQCRGVFGCPRKDSGSVFAQIEEAVAKVHPVEFRADQEALRIFKNAVLATEEDYSTEFLDYIMSVKIVKTVEEAVDWINGHTTHHSKRL